MATFIDIAKLAGVSYGTVSNVMNGRGNVSSEKVKRVQEAANRLGYTANFDAKSLRKGSSNTLAVILPNISDTKYADFYLSFRNFTESAGYRVSLYIHDSNPQRESDLVQEIRASHPAGTAVISSLSGHTNYYRQAGFTIDELIFAEQKPFNDYDYVGFDYSRIGREMGKRAAKYHQVALLTEASDSYVTRELSAGFIQEASANPSCIIHHYDKESSVRSAALALDILSSDSAPEAVFAANYSHAEMVDNVRKRFFPQKTLDIYTISRLFTMPETSYHKYELNYRLLGKATAEQLINRIEGKAPSYFQNILLPEAGFRSWNPGPVPEKSCLTMLTLDSPTAYIMKHMASLYKSYTGIDVNVTIYPYDGIHELLTSMNENNSFDIIRLDATWMSWFAPRIYEPLSKLENNLKDLQERFLPGLMDRYGSINGELYALPETPSTQMLFYRRDIFEDTAIKRLFQEQNHAALRLPRTFGEYNTIASFFTRSINSRSPVKYGSTITLGNTGTAATEFLTRYFALTNDLFDKNDHLLLNTPTGIQALNELVECSHYANLSFSNWWRDTARDFAEGNTAMTILYSNYASEIIGKESTVRGKIGYAMVPGENPLFGGGSIGVSHYSHHKDLAYHFIRWLCDEQVASAMTLLGSISPCRNTYNNYQIIDTYPWLAMTNECFEKSNAHRQPHAVNVSFNERHFLEILGFQVLNAINGRCTVKEALENAENNYG
ncbi:MAG: hypothetical protein CW338_06260 [Clostridiales bacterium]|nr:hypothetical protein [Clostridiales bacterium]